MVIRAAKVVGYALFGVVVGIGIALFLMFANNLSMGDPDYGWFWPTLSVITGIAPSLLIALFAWGVFATVVPLCTVLAISEEFPYEGRAMSEKAGLALPFLLALAGALAGMLLLPIGLQDAAPDVIGWLTGDAIGNIVYNVGSLLAAGRTRGSGRSPRSRAHGGDGRGTRQGPVACDEWMSDRTSTG